MKINANEISQLIKEQIKSFNQPLSEDDTGKVISVGDGIALVYGLEKAMMSELVVFPNDMYGMILNLEEDHVGVALLSTTQNIKEGDIVKRTKQTVEIPVGDALLGRVVNALGQPIDGLGVIKTTRTRPVERIAPGVMTREPVNTPLQTGIMGIDAMIPIGRGQRELLIGDRQTGKTAIAIDAIINQKDQNVLCIYVAIGQKNSTVANIVDRLKQTGAMAYTTVVAASASEIGTLQWLAPFSGTAIGEEWLEAGKDVLIVYDDLSKHAVAYRTLSLLLRRPPGREAYPGDIFYLHSRLLERSCKLDAEHGGGSLTALPIIETQAGDNSAYIPTNVISITDGQIFLVTDLFNSGQRPAIDSGQSVSRVGGAAQISAMKQVVKSLKIELANYRELQSFAQFGSDIDPATKRVLTHGQVLMNVLKQNQYEPLPVEVQILYLYAVQNRFVETVDAEHLKPLLKSYVTFIESKHPIVIEDIKVRKKFSDATLKLLKEITTSFFSSRVNG
jgi:F-type H+/Na+-transporting ATPase subunit alpha